MSFRASRTVFNPDDSDEDATEDADDAPEIWKLLPQLHSLPESWLKKLSISALFQLNSALEKNSKHTAKLSTNAKLVSNAQKVVKTPVKVEAGRDNRRDILHAARFLGGASCSNVELWLHARKLIGDEGVTALGNYDLDSVGCGGCVTPKAWQELHNPASQELKLRLFHLPNVVSSGMSAKRVNLDTGDDALSIGDSLKEIADMDSFKAALNTAREALHSALPWNRSICALVGFMQNSSYLQSDLGGHTKRAAILTQFTDYIFGRNALAWENSQPFVTADEMSHVWANWKGKQASLFLLAGPKIAEKRRERIIICKRYNAGTCPSQNDKECKSTFGFTLKHLCNKFTGNGKMCEKAHPRKDHK